MVNSDMTGYDVLTLIFTLFLSRYLATILILNIVPCQNVKVFLDLIRSTGFAQIPSSTLKKYDNLYGKHSKLIESWLINRDPCSGLL